MEPSPRMQVLVNKCLPLGEIKEGTLNEKKEKKRPKIHTSNTEILILSYHSLKNSI